MSIAMSATKLIVHDLETIEQFYVAIGMTVVGQNVGGEDEVRQKQSWLSSGAEGGNPHMLILSQFLEIPTPSKPDYPGEVWLAFTVSDVEETVKMVGAAGGKTMRPGQDRPEHGVRSAVVCDPEGHILEIVGPLSDA